MKVVLAFVVAVIVTYVLAVVSYSQLNLASLIEMGVPVDAGVRFGTALHDLLGMVLYLAIIVVGFLIAFSVTRLILNWVPQLRKLGYVLAGFVAIFAADFLLSNVVAGGTHPLHVTMTTVGLLSQCVAGAIGGYVFVRLLGEPAIAE